MKYAKWIAVLMMVIVPVIAAAQMPGTEQIRAQVPFTFVVANHAVPLGECTIQRADPSGRVLVISSPGAKVNVFATASMTENQKASENYVLVFHKYGMRYYLVGLKLENSRIGYSMTLSDFEKELLAQNEQPTEVMLLASAK